MTFPSSGDTKIYLGGKFYRHIRWKCLNFQFNSFAASNQADLDMDFDLDLDQI